MEALVVPSRGESQTDAEADARARMLAGLELAERRVDAAGIDTAILEAGEGPPLVLLHGGIECGGAYWAPMIERLAEGHRLIVPDVPGLGESEPVRRLDGAAFSRWFGALVEATCAGPPTVVAHSLLGGLAGRFAAEPERDLSGLIVYAAPGVGRYRVPLRLRIVAMRFALRPNERNAERFERFALLDRARTRARAPVWFDSFSAYTLARARVRHVKRTMRRLVGEGTRRVPDAELRRIRCPVSLLWGREDRMVPLSLASEASARLGWPLHVVDDAAHAPHIERPEAFTATLSTAIATSRTLQPQR